MKSRAQQTLRRRACVSPAMGERLAAAALEEKNGRILKDIVKKGC